MDRNRDTDSEDIYEEAALLGGMRIPNRPVTAVEGRLILLAFIFLCIGSVGFGLFAGEVSKYEDLQNKGHEVVIVTSTVNVPNPEPTPPSSRPKRVCYSGPCVEAAGELRKTIDWEADPCRDFDRFAMRRTENLAIDVFKADISHFIGRLLSTRLDPSIQTLAEFYSTCIRTTNLYHESLPFLYNISAVWNATSHFDTSRTTRITSALAYAHARALPVLFTNSLAGGRLQISPVSLNVIGIEEAFREIYPLDQAAERIQGMKRLKRRLDEIMDHTSGSQLITIEKLQHLVCHDKPAPCLLSWNDYYSSLSSIRPISEVVVSGLDYFRRLPSVVAAQSDKTMESYFHWILISTLVRSQHLPFQSP